MKSDTIKTIVGLVVIGGIVVATFLYGNAQRQAQLSHDQEVKKQQEAKATPASPTVSPTASASATVAAGSNTAPVASPSSNAIQGSGAATPTSAPAATATPTPAVAGASTVPDTGGTGQPAPLPDTGPEVIGLLGMSSIGVMALGVRRSRKATLKAMRAKRS